MDRRPSSSVDNYFGQAADFSPKLRRIDHIEAQDSYLDKHRQGRIDDLLVQFPEASV
jgi:hypothetical protein